MGNCSSANADKALEEVDPPVSQSTEEEKPHPAPITVDLSSPAVDVSAPLDERDIDLVQQTFARVAMLGAETVGWVLFMNIFKIAPGAKDLFPFKDEDLATSAKMRKHAANVVNTVATAVSLLRDLDTLVPVLQSLGLRHVGYGVIPAHYDVVGQALIQALGTALGPHMTEAVTNAYLKVFTIVKTTMISQCNYDALPAAAEPAEATEEAAKEAPAAAAPVAQEAPAPAAEPAAEEAAETEAKEEPEAAPEAEAAGKAEEEPKKKAPEEVTEKKETAEDGHKVKKVPNSSQKNVKKQPDHSAKKRKDDETAKKKKAQDEDAKKKAAEEAKAKAEAEKAAEASSGPSPEEQLRMAVDKSDDKLCAKLLKSGVNVNAVDAEGKSALMLAAEKGEMDIASRLVMAKGIKVNLKTSTTKETALHLACRAGHRDCAVVIVRAGADLKASSKAGKAPYQLTDDAELIKWLQGNNPSGTPPPWQGQKMR